MEKGRKPNSESEKRFRIAQSAASVLRSRLTGIYSILLFGSTAKGIARPNSDIDLAVITQEETDLTDIQVLDILLSVNDDSVLTMAQAAQFNPVVMSYEELMTKSQRNTFYKNILHDGIQV